jgi:hypothetical protein
MKWTYLDHHSLTTQVEGSATNLYLLLQTLKAISSIQELVQTNRTLKDLWKSRQHDIFQGVVQMFLAAGGRSVTAYNSIFQLIPLQMIKKSLKQEAGIMRA